LAPVFRWGAPRRRARTGLAGHRAGTAAAGRDRPHRTLREVPHGTRKVPQRGQRPAEERELPQAQRALHVLLRARRRGQVPSKRVALVALAKVRSGETLFGPWPSRTGSRCGVRAFALQDRRLLRSACSSPHRISGWERVLGILTQTSV